MKNKNFDKRPENIAIDQNFDLIEIKKIAQIIVEEKKNIKSPLIEQIKKYDRQQEFLNKEIKLLKEQVKNQTPKPEIKAQTKKLEINETNKLIKINLQEELTKQIAELESQQKKNDMQMASDFINFFKKNNIIIEQLSEKPLEVLLKYLSCSNPTIIAKLIKHIIINK